VPATGGLRNDRHYLNVSRVLTALFGVVQIVVAIVAISLSSRVVDEVLGIASFTNGVILGVFFLGTFTWRVGQRAAFAGILGGSLLMLAVKLGTAIHWQWYVLIGSVATFAIGWLASLMMAGTARASSALRP
jgi:solute:Na+ symporter, SSS family